MSTSNFSVQIRGHGHIVDDRGNVILDKGNEIHPQNMSRVIARALSNTPNSGIFRLAFGNGGTEVDAAHTVTYRTPNVGFWDSRLYRETFSKVVDRNSPDLGQDLGSADSQTGIRPGGGAILDPSNDIGVDSFEPDNAVISEVVIKCTLNAGEPLGQYNTSYLPPSSSTETDFVFDEMGLYSKGLQPINTIGYQLIDVNDKHSLDDTGLIPDTTYQFNIAVDGNPAGVVSFTTPATGGTGLSGEILYGDLCEAINTEDSNWQVTGKSHMYDAKMLITDNSMGAFPSIDGAQTYGNLRVDSSTTGGNSSVNMAGPATELFLTHLVPQGTLLAPVQGTIGGDKNNTIDPARERERLLAHLIFSPVQKAADRIFYITYTLTVVVVSIKTGETT